MRRESEDFGPSPNVPRKGWKEVFQVMKSKDLQPELLYTAKLVFKIQGQVKWVKPKEFIITKPLLYEMLKELI